MTHCCGASKRAPVRARISVQQRQRRPRTYCPIPGRIAADTLMPSAADGCSRSGSAARLRLWSPRHGLRSRATGGPVAAARKPRWLSSTISTQPSAKYNAATPTFDTVAAPT